MSKCKITGKVLAIRVGREETQIALIGNGSDILHSQCLMTPAGAVEDGMIRNQEAIRGMLRVALKDPALKHVRQVVFSLCTSQVITHTDTVPKLSGSKVEKLLQANIDMYFPVDMKDYHISWQIIGEKQQENGQKELSVQLWAVPIAMLAPYYNIANACGLSVAAVDYCGNSLATAVGASFGQPAKAAKNQKKDAEAAKSEASAQAATELHILAEGDLLGMTFVQNGQVVLQRFIQCVADPAYQFSEVAMMVEYFRSLEIGRGSMIRGIVSGTLGWNQALMAEMADSMGMPLSNFVGGYDSRLILCVGAARTTFDFGVTTMNSPSKARNQVSGHLWQYALVLVGGLALIGSILITLSSRLVWDAEIQSLQTTQQTLMIQAAQTNGYADNYNNYASSYASYSSDWDTVFGSLQTYNDNVVLVIEELESIMPENASVVSLQIAADGMSITFACEDKEEAAYLIMSLRELEYADLVGISNLSGGGKGPATSYGPEESEVEDAPTEGNARKINSSAVTDMISSQLDEDQMMMVAKTMTPEQFDALEKAYAKQPDTNHESLAALGTENPGQITDTVRKDAMHRMFTTDPMADNHFVDLLVEDFKRGDEAILWWLILDDLVQLQLDGKLDMSFDFDSVEDIEAMRDQMELLIGVLTQDAETMDAVEKLICTDPALEKSYIHYLEVEMGLRPLEPFPYLDLEKVFADVLSGGFKTEDPELNEKLNGLISDELWALIDTLNSEEELGALLNQYLTAGTTGSAVVDELIDNYINAGTTGYPQVDAKIQDFLKSGKMDQMLAELLTKYIQEGTTGSQICDDLIKNYLVNGTSGNADLDAVIQKYIGTGALDHILEDLLDKYLADGTTGNEVLDSLLEKFLRTGSTGNSAVDGVIKAYLESGKLNTLLEEMFGKYLKDGTTGNKLMDELIKKYMDTGSTGNAVLDKMINAYIDEVLGDLDDAKISELVNKYLKDKTTGNDLYDALLKKYFNDGTTGIKKLDELIENYKNGVLNGGSSDDILGWLDKFFGNGSSGGGGTGTVPADTRIFFTATLTYSEELKTAELERKGLDYTDKIEPLEVDES